MNCGKRSVRGRALRVALVLLRASVGEKSEFKRACRKPGLSTPRGVDRREDVRAMQYPPAEKMAREQRDENAEA